MAEAVNSLQLSIFCCCFWTIFVLPIAEAVWMSLPSSGIKCVSEEIHSNVVVLGNYYSFYESDHSEKLPSMSVTVTSPYGNNLHQKENVTHGEFAFTTSEAGYYVACFSLDGNHQESDGAVSLGIDWKIGIAAKDWESVAKKEKIEGVELELTKLQGAVQAIHENLNYLKNREAEMRVVSERTNARVAWFGGMALGVCIVVSCAQVWYLKRFFQKKKLI